MKETATWRLIRKNTPSVFWTRLESGSTALGIPDTVGIYRGATAWIENKNGEDPSEWTTFQMRWAAECNAHGGRYWLLYGYRNRFVLYDWMGRIVGEFKKPINWKFFKEIIWG